MLEHITTREAAQYVRGRPLTPPPPSQRTTCSTAATHFRRAAPHYYCPPVLKRETHRQALVQAATSGRNFSQAQTAPHHLRI